MSQHFDRLVLGVLAQFELRGSGFFDLKTVDSQTHADAADSFGERPYLLPLRKCTPLVSFLVSSGIHLSLLVALTVLFISIPPVEQMNLEFSIASSQAEPEFESFEMDVLNAEIPELPDEASSTTPVSAPAGIEVIEPSLAEVESLAGAPAEGDSDSTSESTSTTSKAATTQRKGSFFGAEAYGDEFVFVVDNSRSMLSPCGFRYGHTRFQVACQELLRSIKSLDDDQKFCVIFFGLRTRVMFDRQPKLVKATADNRKKLVKWIGKLSPGAGTDPRYGVLQALKLKPSAIFLLSDGEFNGQLYNAHQLKGNPTTEQVIHRHLHRSIPIHTFAFEDVVNRKRLRNIATLTAGSHKFIGSQSEEQLLVMDLKSNDPTDVKYALQTIADDGRALQNDAYIQPATFRLVKLLRSRNRDFRESAHQAMLTLADSLDVDVAELTSLDDLASAKLSKKASNLWSSVWSGYFRNRRAETRLTRVVSPN